MMKNLKRIFCSFLIKIGVIKPYEYWIKLVSDHPAKDDLLSKQIYIVGGQGYQKWAYLRCPCGCNEKIMLCLSKNKKPSWSVKIDFWGRPSIFPSIRQQSGCESHFWINKGSVSWCADSIEFGCVNKKIFNIIHKKHNTQ